MPDWAFRAAPARNPSSHATLLRALTEPGPAQSFLIFRHGGTKKWPRSVGESGDVFEGFKLISLFRELRLIRRRDQCFQNDRAIQIEGLSRIADPKGTS